MQQWFVVETKVSQEKIAEENITNQGWPVYLPLETRRYFGRGSHITVRAIPYFSRYLFARFDLREHGWQSIWNTKGVHCILGSPTPVADQIIIDIQRALGSEDELSPNDRVRIHGGTWHGAEGLFSKQEGDRVSVLLSLLQKPIVVDVERKCVESLGQQVATSRNKRGR